MDNFLLTSMVMFVFLSVLCYDFQKGSFLPEMKQSVTFSYRPAFRDESAHSSLKSKSYGKTLTLFHSQQIFYQVYPSIKHQGCMHCHEKLRLVPVPRPLRNEIHIGGLKRGASEASKNGGPGACPRENFP